MSTELFVEFRPLLFTIAYEITGSATETEDVLQESYLRWADVDATKVANPRAYLAQMVTRQALNHLRSQARRREEYVGPWLPEPLRTAKHSDSAEDDVLLAESVSMAMLVVLETLSPDERAVFVLREVFGFEYAEIAESLDKTPDAVRQIAHRAREHVGNRRRRFTPTSQMMQEVSDRFLTAAATGEVQALMNVLAPDVVLIADGGGKVTTARRPIIGAADVAAFLAGLVAKSLSKIRIEPAMFNEAPGILVYVGRQIDLALLLQVGDGVIDDIYIVRNPDKLAAVDQVQRLAR